MHDAPRPEPRPSARRRTAASAVLALEALTLLGVATVVVADSAGHPELPRSFTMGLAAVLALFAVAVGAAALSVVRHRRFGIGFGITWQLFQALVSASLLRGALFVPGALGMICAIVAFVLLLRLSRETPTPLEED